MFGSEELEADHNKTDSKIISLNSHIRHLKLVMMSF